MSLESSNNFPIFSPFLYCHVFFGPSGFLVGLPLIAEPAKAAIINLPDTTRHKGGQAAVVSGEACEHFKLVARRYRFKVAMAKLEAECTQNISLDNLLNLSDK